MLHPSPGELELVLNLMFKELHIAAYVSWLVYLHSGKVESCINWVPSLVR